MLQITVQLNLNFIHVCGYMHARTCFTRVKVYNVECIFFVACGFVVCTREIKQLWHTRHAPHEQTRHEHTFNHMWYTTQISLSRVHILPSNTHDAPDMHHTSKLITSTSSLYELPLLRSTTVVILLNEKSSLQNFKVLQVN